MKLKPVVAALFIALPAAAQESSSLSVQELRSRLPAGENAYVDRGELAEQVRDVARRMLPDLRIADAAEPAADLSVTGELAQLDQGYLASLELRDTRSSKLLGTTSAVASTPEELTEVVASAAVDLFRGYKAASALEIAAAGEPTPPAPLDKLDARGADASVLVSLDEAVAAERDNPADAAAAWRAVAEQEGENPVREIAAARAKAWQTYAESKKAFDAQLSRDTARLRKVLPMAAVTDGTKIELLVRYTRAYGRSRATALLPLVPAGARPVAELSVGCEAKDASMCVALARRADDPKTAIDYFDQACAAADSAACAEAGDRLLRAETRDPARAIASLERGCVAGGAPACARLARVYEEGDGVVPNLSLAAETRQKACTAGDGASCRKLACDVPSELPRARELWQQGCKEGDAISCALAGTARAPAGEGTAVAGKPSTTPPAAPRNAVTDSAKAARDRQHAAAALVGVAAVAVGGAVFFSMNNPDEGWHEGARWLTKASASAPHPRSKLPLILGAAGMLSAGTGLALLLTRPEEPKKVSLGVAPSGVVLSGTLP